MDFVGKLDDVAFEGGSATDFAMVLGEGRMLPDFEAGAIGKAAGETGTFDVAFPEDYNAKELAGKTARFEVTVKKVEEPAAAGPGQRIRDADGRQGRRP